MERRNVNQVKVYGLILNTMGSAEEGRIAAVASSKDKLKEYYVSQLLEKGEWVSGWYYSFKKGPLRHFNPSGVQDANEDIYGHGIIFQWVNENEIREDVHRVDF